MLPPTSRYGDLITSTSRTSARIFHQQVWRAFSFSSRMSATVLRVNHSFRQRHNIAGMSLQTHCQTISKKNQPIKLAPQALAPLRAPSASPSTSHVTRSPQSELDLPSRRRNSILNKGVLVLTGKSKTSFSAQPNSLWKSSKPPRSQVAEPRHPIHLGTRLNHHTIAALDYIIPSQVQGGVESSLTRWQTLRASWVV